MPAPVAAPVPPDFAQSEVATPPPPPDDGEALFYVVPDDLGEVSFQQHARQIAIIAPQSYSLDRYGLLHGSMPDDLLAVAHKNDVPIMPLVINRDFSRTQAERLLRSAVARDHAIGELVETGRELGLIGWQLDFEGMASYDRAYFTRFVTDAADALHRHGMLLSVAVAARTEDDPTSDNWRSFSGVYDYSALGQSADFLSVMAYPESDGSHPGPLASYPWVERVVQHVLVSVPPDKVSLGLPTYQTDWYQRRIRTTVRERVGNTVKRVVHYIYRLFRHSGPVNEPDEAAVQWDPVLRSSYRIEGEGHQQRISWIEDERSFEAKLALVAQYHLRGFSVWRIGLEDPRIWNELPDATRRTSVSASEDPAIRPFR